MKKLSGFHKKEKPAFAFAGFLLVPIVV